MTFLSFNDYHIDIINLHLYIKYESYFQYHDLIVWLLCFPTGN